MQPTVDMLLDFSFVGINWRAFGHSVLRSGNQFSPALSGALCRNYGIVPLVPLKSFFYLNSHYKMGELFRQLNLMTLKKTMI